MTGGLQSLTEKEKQALRLVVRGYDAKSAAGHLGLSVHTVNERLRLARRKLEVSSSREAGRMLVAREGADPYSLGDKSLGDAGEAGAAHARELPVEGSHVRSLPVVLGVLAMTILIAGLALTLMSSAAPSVDAPAAVAAPSQIEQVARGWLEMIDRADWAGSYSGTTASFRKSNTLAAWAAASEKVRGPLGTMVNRTLVSSDAVPSNEGYQVVKFRTKFSGGGHVETVSLVREDGQWKVAGVYMG